MKLETAAATHHDCTDCCADHSDYTPSAFIEAFFCWVMARFEHMPCSYVS